MYKCQTIIDMRSSSNVKEVHQLTECLASISCFLSCASDKFFHFFSMINKKERFEWTSECDEAFSKLEAFIVSPPILTI